MSEGSEFMRFVAEQLAFVQGLRIQGMFGGYGVYQDDRIFAIIVADRLYLKTDSSTRGDFEAKGLRPFTYVARGKSVTLRYFEAPPEVFEASEAMRDWVRRALQAAANARKTKTPANAFQRRGKRSRAADI